MKTTITFFNHYGLGQNISTFKTKVGDTIDIYDRTGKTPIKLGTGIITKIEDKTIGVSITYETEADLGLLFLA